MLDGERLLKMIMDCPANFVPVAMIETGAKGAGYGAREEARS
jgi:hypothetical protein